MLFNCQLLAFARAFTLVTAFPASYLCLFTIVIMMISSYTKFFLCSSINEDDLICYL